MAKHLVDIDDAILRVAQRELRTRTIKDTIHQALRRVVGGDAAKIKRALDDLARVSLTDRKAAWR